MTSLSNTQPYFKPGAMQNTALSHHVAFEMFAAAVERAVKGKGKRWLRKRAFTCSDAMGVSQQVGWRCVFFFLERQCSQRVGAHPFNLLIFPRHAGPVGCSELNLFFFHKGFFFFFPMCLFGKKKCFGLKFDRTDIQQVCLEVKSAAVHWLQLPLWLQRGAECVSEIDAGNKV